MLAHNHANIFVPVDPLLNLIGAISKGAIFRRDSAGGGGRGFPAVVPPVRNGQCHRDKVKNSCTNQAKFINKQNGIAVSCTFKPPI